MPHDTNRWLIICGAIGILLSIAGLITLEIRKRLKSNIWVSPELQDLEKQGERL